jgi:hypothetical protein
LCWGGRGVWVDRSAGAELTSVQLRRLLESDNHITIRLPSLVVDVPHQMLGESIRRQIGVGHRLREVGLAERDQVFIRGELMAPVEGLHSVGGFAPQGAFYLLRNDGPAEHPGKRVADGGFELALDTLHEAHVTVLPLYLAPFARRADRPACPPSTLFFCMVSVQGTAAGPSEL